MDQVIAEPRPSAATAPRWYQDCVIYQTHVRAFLDSDGDGIGDFPGLIRKLDYIRDLGVNAIWVLPFYPSPGKDDGYDIADYHKVHPQYGTLRDFRQFVREAHRRDLKVITELVINHTSDQHPWFQAARRAPAKSAKRDYYVWSDRPDKYAGTRIIFTDTETSNWAWDDVARAYYWHRFFSHQPDLNFDNPSVVRAVTRVMRYWLDLGVDGLRLDAVPYLCEREGTDNENLRETHAVIKEIRRVVDAHYHDRMLLAEANQWPEDVRDYFGDGDECHMAYHFPLMPRIYMAIAQEDRHPIVDIMEQTPEIPDTCQWAIFLRNHDELTLEMVTSKERDYMYQIYAADARMRVNLGIRRRLAPLMDNDSDKIKLVNSLLLSMPGSPIIYYGDELGMGDNIYLGDRNGVRTPMQWSPDRNAGFSSADPQRLYLPPIMDPIFGYEAVNVEAQSRDPSSLLNWMKRILQVRKSSTTFGTGELKFLNPGNRKVLAYVRHHGDDIALCVANLARSAQPVELDLSDFKGRVPVELMGRTAFPPIGELPYLLTLPGHAFYWFRLSTIEDAPAWHEERLPPEHLPVLVLFDGWNSFFPDRAMPWRRGMAQKTRTRLENEMLPRFIAHQRWYAAKGTHIDSASLDAHTVWQHEQGDWLLGIFRIEDGAEETRYFMPLTLAWEDDDQARVRKLQGSAVARARQQAAVGLVGDAFAEESFVHAVIDAIATGTTLVVEQGHIVFEPTAAFTEIRGDLPPDAPVSLAHAQGSNTSVAVGETLFLKGYRQVRFGVSPEIEMSRFLTEVAGYPHIAPVAGTVELRGNDGSVAPLAILQAQIRNQGDFWEYTLNYLERLLEEQREPGGGAHGGYLKLVGTLGSRLAELHLALASATGQPAFDPRPMTTEDVRGWTARARDEAGTTLGQLAARSDALPQAARDEARHLLHARGDLLKAIERAVDAEMRGLAIRYHGDFHLGQALLYRNDFVLVDFEGEPARPPEQRREKGSPLRDVAGVLRSFDYARHTTWMRFADTGVEGAARAQTLLYEWHEEARRALLDAYAQVVSGTALIESFDTARGVLRLFEIEKALYEIRYELAHRPDWVRAPIRGLLALCGAQLPDPNLAAGQARGAPVLG